MKKPEELDLRAISTPQPTLRCSISEHEIYEVRFETLRRYGSSGGTDTMRVFRSLDCGQAWQSVRLRRNWPRHWWSIFWHGLGGTHWPPDGNFVEAVYSKDGKLAISYCNPWELGLQGQAYVWEMVYDLRADTWDLYKLKEEFATNQ